MLNSLAKLLLVSTALAPVLGAVGVNQFARHEHWSQWAGWLGTGLLLVLLCWAMLRYAIKNLPYALFHIKEFERNDKEVLAFLLAYLLPFVSKENMAFAGDWATGAYILGIIFIVIAHAGAFHFNPVMGLLGYHFYSVKNGDGISNLLISRNELTKANIDVQTVHLAHGIYLDQSDKNA